VDPARAVPHHQSTLSATTGRDIHQAEIEASMRYRSVVSPLLVPGLFALCALISGCSKSNKSTNVVQVTEPFESGDLSNSGPNSIFVHTFSTAGSFSYRCRHHGSMTGVVSVIAGGVDSVTVPITDFAFGAGSPIKPGGHVRWENHGTVHTVTRP